MIGDTWRLLNTAVYAFSQDATQQPQRYEHPQELSSTLILPELIEAAVRSGHTARAADALEPLAETTRAAATEWALGTEARSRALLAANQAAEDLYRERGDRPPRTHRPGRRGRPRPAALR